MSSEYISKEEYETHLMTIAGKLKSHIRCEVCAIFEPNRCRRVGCTQALYDWMMSLKEE